MTVEITVPDGWIEREPEQLEQRLFVTKETGGLLGITAKGHVAYYADDVIEVYKDGEYTFYNADDTTLQEALNDVSE